MRTEIMYDGRVIEQRANILNNLVGVIQDKSIYKDIRDAEACVAIKESIKDYAGSHDIKSHIFLDIKLGDTMYPVVVVGDYGIAVTQSADNGIFRDNQRIHLIGSMPDIVNIKMPWVGHPYRSYEQFVLDNRTVPAMVDYIGKSYAIDDNLLFESSLWSAVKLRRDMIAESKNTEPSMVFKYRDVYNLLCLYPEQHVVTSPIAAEYQEIILRVWKQFLWQEGVVA